MFSGLVQGVGRIVDVRRPRAEGDPKGVTLVLDARGVDGFRAALGDSIAINGACMTATAVAGDRFEVDVSAESLARTTGLDRTGEVNLETSLRIGDPIGGHLVLGHVDGVAQVLQLAPVGTSCTLVLRLPTELASYFAYKGSVAVNGVSLTVNEVADSPAGCDITINLIPHTLQATTLRSLRAGDRVNIEVDVIARYVVRALSVAAR